MPRLGRTHPFAATAGLLVSLVLPVWAQSSATATRSIDSIRRLPPIAQAVRTRVSTEVTFDWSASAGAPVPAAAGSRSAMPALHGFQMQGSRQAADPPQRERDPQIGPDDIVVVALDAQGVETSWQRVRDPRILRAEMPDGTGLLSGETLYRTDTELTVTVPDDGSAVLLDVYEPVSAGGTLALRPLARVALR